ncbi:leishmanolysin-like peptidase 2 isoform X2 [Thalassophryne amazonica]|uniref:leishmanolysin-like peptidase 2 isoform X2 n=1 Tax=Thalassophryne amazonica TaxID=390379 RepID=UPI0014716426|nr:leishmanolysin-like peptidase 2 isoform X2 [Thalassophryne amazonica]
MCSCLSPPSVDAMVAMVTMALAPALWVGVLVLVLVEVPVAVQKCIFDEVQAQVRVVRASTSPPKETGPRVQNGQLVRHLRQRSSPLRDLSVKQRGSLREAPLPIRIRTWVTRESQMLSESEQAKLEAAVGEAVGTVSSLLSVRRVTGPLLLSRDQNKYCKFIWRDSRAANYNRCGRANIFYRTETCLDVNIPDEHLRGCDVFPEADSSRRTVLRPDGAGVPDTDFLMYLLVQTTDKCRAERSLLAYAVHCQTDSGGKPLAGVVVVCRDKLSTAAYRHNTAVQTVIHELFHVLGFSKELFHTWTDCSSSTPAGVGCSPRVRALHPDGSGQMRIYTQSVISALQRHLESTDPELGGPLENQDAPPGGVSSHWESRFLQGSIMAAMLPDTNLGRIDPVTLAALQDTGWYSVNQNQAQNLVWGRGEGSTFGSLSTCQHNSSWFFCTGSGFGCHYLHLHKGECQTDPYLEGCRVFKPLKNRSECWRVENAPPSAQDNPSVESFGLDSRCFFSNLTAENQSGSVAGRCYRHRCTGPETFQIQVSGSDWMDCPAGSTVQVRGYQGLVFCPQRRLCSYADADPPSDSITGFTAGRTSASGSSEVLMPVQTRTRPPPELLVAAGLGVVGAVCLQAAVRTLCRKFWPIRIHAAAPEPSEETP